MKVRQVQSYQSNFAPAYYYNNNTILLQVQMQLLPVRFKMWLSMDFYYIISEDFHVCACVGHAILVLLERPPRYLARYASTLSAVLKFTTHAPHI